jgi:hypothetical protein
LTVAPSVTRNPNDAMVGLALSTCGLRWCVWLESGLRQREDVFTLNLLLQEFNKCCTSNAICEDNAAINRTSV